MSNPSFTGAQLLLGVEIIVLASVTLFLLWHYADNTVSRLVLWNVGISWFLGFLGTLLLPFDLALSSSSLDDGVPQGILSAWQLIYWVTWLMSWVVLPVLLEFEVSGEFSTWRRLLNAVRANVWLYLAGAAAVGIFVAVRHVTDVGGSGNGGVAFLIAAGNAYGVLLVIVLLGTGVVALPLRARRRAEWLAEPGGTTMRLWIEQRAVALDDERHDVDSALAEVAGRARVCCRQVAAAAEAAASTTTRARHSPAKDMRMSARLLDQTHCALQLLDVVVTAGSFDEECSGGEQSEVTPSGARMNSGQGGGDAHSPSRVASSFSVSSALSAVQRAHDHLQHALSAGSSAPPAMRQHAGSARGEPSAPSSMRGSKHVPESVSRKELVAVHRAAKAALRRRRRNFACWSALLAEHDRMETDSRAGVLPHAHETRTRACQTQRGGCWRVAAVLAAFMSLLVCWCEATVGIDRTGEAATAGDNSTRSATGASAVANSSRTPWEISPIGSAATALVSVGAAGGSGTGASARAAAMQLLLLLPYVYVSTAIYAALFGTKCFGSYSLIGSTRPHEQLLSQLLSSIRSRLCRRSASRLATPVPISNTCGGLSDASALLVNAMYQCRLQFALAYNFLLALHLPTVLMDGTAFVNFYRLGMDVVPVLGADGLTLYAPLAMLFIALITLLRSIRGSHCEGRNRGACCACSDLARDEGALSLRAPLAPHSIEESMGERGRRRIDGAKLIQIRQRHRRNRNRVTNQSRDDGGTLGNFGELEMQCITKPEPHEGGA